MWGVGGLTWGLMIRYLGVGLGLAIGCGLCASAGTLIPPIFKGEFGTLVSTNWGIATLIGIGVAIVGIVFTGAAGMSKEQELSDEEKKATVAENPDMVTPAQPLSVYGGLRIESRRRRGARTKTGVNRDTFLRPGEKSHFPS